MGSLVGYAVCALLSYFLLSTVYCLFFHPLAHVPGPFLARISLWPSFYHAFKGNRHIWIWRNFELYGPNFRAGPNVVLFRSPDAHNDIYSHQANVRKSSFYDALVRHKNDRNTFNTTNPALHAQKRRSMNLAFTEQSIKAAGTFVASHVDRWNEITLSESRDDDGWTTPKSMATWTERLVFDILGDLCFGVSFNTKEPGENPLKVIQSQIADSMLFLYSLSKTPWLDSLVWMKPRGLDKILDIITPKNMHDYHAFVERSVRKRLKQEEDRLRSNGSLRQDMFHFICSAKDPDTKQPVFTTTDLISEGSVLTVAGSDTTATTICSLIFYLTHNATIYDKLVEEIRSTFASYEEIVHGTRLNDCKYLRACINEALRMAPPIPPELPRIIQKGGQTIAGEHYPAGTIVGTSEWANGRNKDVYGGDAETFRPERWVVSEENPLSEVNRMRSCLSPFSKGPANCVGQNLALWELLIVVARTLCRLDIRLAPGETLGEGDPSRGWGMNNPLQYHVVDAYIAIRTGPIVQFRERARA